MDQALDSVAVLVVILIVDFAITLRHSYQEWKGAGAPLWRNFGAIVGLDIPDAFGFPAFTIGLTVALFAIGFIGIIGPFNATVTACALGLLIGARLSDTLVSHVLPHAIGYRPIPDRPRRRFMLLKRSSCFGRSTRIWPRLASLQDLDLPSGRCPSCWCCRDYGWRDSSFPC